MKLQVGISARTAVVTNITYKNAETWGRHHQKKRGTSCARAHYATAVSERTTKAPSVSGQQPVHSVGDDIPPQCTWTRCSTGRMSHSNKINEIYSITSNTRLKLSEPGNPIHATTQIDAAATSCVPTTAATTSAPAGAYKPY